MNKNTGTTHHSLHSLLIKSAMIIMLFTSNATAQELKLPYHGISLNANLELAPGKTLADGVILISHGSQAHNRLELIAGLQQRFLDQGFSTLAINFSLGLDNRHGLYDCAVPSTYQHADAINEIATWFDWLKAQGAQDIVLLGHSRGGNQTAWFAAEHNQPEIESLVLLAPGVSTTNVDAQSYQQRFGTVLDPVLAKAQALVNEGKGNTLMEHVSFLFICRDTSVTATSFVSHYAPDARRDTPYWLPKLNKPTLVIVAGADEVVPGLEKRVLPYVDGIQIQVQVIDGSEHLFRDLYSDDAVDAAIAFIESSHKAKIH